MGNECCHLQATQPLTQIQRYECFHIERSLQKLRVKSKSTSLVTCATFLSNVGLSRAVADHVTIRFGKDGHLNWRECLSGLLLCVRGSTAQKAPLFVDIFDFEEKISREALTEAISIALHAVQRLCVPGSRALFPCVDTVAVEVAASAYRHQDGSVISAAALQQWSERYPQLAAPPPVAPPTTSPSPCAARWLYVGGEGSGGEGPSARSKHAVCMYGDVVYMHGGKAGNVACRDLWKCRLGTPRWERIRDKGERPPNLQGHSLMAYKNKLYVFGGNFGYSAHDTPLWILDIESCVWVKQRVTSEVMTPSSRRHHTAVLYGGAMYVYGGYIDLKGSSGQLWTYDLEENQWHLQQCPGSSEGGGGPGARHSHSASVHGGGMWVVGGMTDLKQRDDMWHWDFGCHEWTRVRCSGRVPELSGHSASVVGGVTMLLHGGVTDGLPHNDTWMFNFASSSWSRLVLSTLLTPTPRTEHCAILLSPFLLASLSPPPTTSAHHGSSQPRCTSLPALKDSKPKPQPRPSSSPAIANTESTEDGHMFQNRIEPVEEVKEPVQETAMTRKERKERLYQKNKTREQRQGESRTRSKMAASMLQQSRTMEGDGETVEMRMLSKSTGSVNKQQLPDETGDSRLNQRSSSKIPPEETNNNNSRVEARRRNYYRRQSSSCDSMTVYNDGVPLLKTRSNTTGNVSIDSNSGFSNPTFVETASMYSRNSSREDHATLPAKRQRSDTQFSDDFVPFSPSRSSRANIGDHVSPGSIDSLLDSFGGVTFTQKVVKHSNLRSPRKSKSTDDLILEDIEDMDIEIQPHDRVSPKRRNWSGSNNNHTTEDSVVTVDENMFLKKDTRPKSVTRRQCEWMDCMEEADPFSSQSELVNHFNQSDRLSHSSQSELLSQFNQSELLTHSSQSELLSQFNQSEDLSYSNQSERPMHSSSSEPRSRVRQAERSMKKHMSVTYQNGAYEKLSSSPKTPSIPSRSTPSLQQYTMYVFGGKELESSSIGQNPLPIWKLEITMQERK